MCKATPVVVDVNLNDWCIDPELVVNAVSDRTKAIIAIDNYGVFANISEIRAKVSKDVLIIQDAAETFPSNFYSGENWFQGDLVTTSFYANKVITSAEGGAICGPSDLIRKITSLKNQSLKSKGIFEHVDIGYNYRISNLHAALFAAQWERISEILERRNLVFKTYFEYLVEFGVDFVSSQFPNYVNPWLMTIRLPGQSDKMTSLRVKLQDIGIETRPGFKTLSNHEYLDEFIKIKSDLEVSNTISKEIISLPTYPELGEKSISFICKSLANLTK
jgi:perosamine synthetase